MTSRDMMPATRSLQSTNMVHHTAAPTLSGQHNSATDYGSRIHEPHQSTVKPLPLQAPMHNGPGKSFFSSDDTALHKQILATHAADITDLNMKPLLSIIENILRFGKPLTAHTPLGGHSLDTLDNKVNSSHHDDKVHQGSYHEDKAHQGSNRDDKAHHGSYHDDMIFPSSEHDAEIIRVLTYPISKTSFEIISKCSAGAEPHAVAMDLLKLLAHYSWDAKVVVTFAAFAISYGEYRLVEQLQNKNLLAKSIALLKDLPDTMEHADTQKKFEAVLDLLNALLKVTHCIIEFKEIPSPYLSHESPELTAATAHIPVAVYWIIRGLLACESVLLNHLGSGHEYLTSTAESWEILSLAHKLSVIMDHLQKQLTVCKDLIERKKEEDAFLAFKKLMDQSHIDNMKVLRAMIRSREDQKPLHDGSKRTTERLEVLRMKYVLLLISDLELPHEELNVLHLIYNQQTMRHEYEVLWLPIVGPKSSQTVDEPLFYDLRNNHMPWYSVDHPSLVEPVAIRYIREAWNFVHMPMVVVLDPQGRASNLDALPMMWIWGSNAFPFTKIREKALWSEVEWKLELLADAIDPRIPEWIREEKVICLYGGEDIEWIRKFTLAARAAATALNVPLEMLYVGKRNPRAKVQRCHEIIDREKLSHIFSLKDSYDYVWYFWVRLWSIWNSKKQLGMTVENDRIMQEIMDVLTFDSSEQGWAVFSRGNFEMTKGKGDVVLTVLENFQTWSNKVDEPNKFVEVLDEVIRSTHPEHHCNRLILPGYSGYIPERVVCSECGKMMDKYVMYRCCTD